MNEIRLQPRDVRDNPINVYSLLVVIKENFPIFYRQHPELTTVQMAQILLVDLKAKADMADHILSEHLKKERANG